MTADPKATQAALDLAFQLAPADRAANVAGRLSTTQRWRLVAGVAESLSGSILGLMVGLVAAVREQLFFAGLATTVGLVLLVRIAGPLSDALRARVILAEGHIDRGGLFFAGVGRALIHFPAGVLDALPPEVEQWRVYYLPRSRRAIGLEPAPSTELGPFR